MSKKSSKPRAASGKAFTSFGASSFGAFSTTATGPNLSYLTEPPDFSAISDANVVVSLKNLQKKDATTKAKALEELIAYVQSHPYEQHGGTEEPILEAWVQLYPRASIDNSRRVRELSHSLQYELIKSTRKRIEKYIPKVVGSWLAGTFDRDKAVSRAANEALSSFLNTPEKVAQFWRRCQQQIIDYASEAIKETTDTLSDQRSTSADDADAKFYRVQAGSLALVLGLLRILEPHDINTCLDSYDQFFETNRVWAGSTAEDALVRRLSCQLLSVCLEKRPDRIKADLSRISKIFVSEGLKTTHVGSATDFVAALTDLTETFSTVWMSNYAGKKSPVARLKMFLEKGSQGSPPGFWSSLSHLLEILPEGVLPEDVGGAVGFLESLRLGLTNRNEPRQNAFDAWSTYLNVAKYFIKVFQSPELRLQLVQNSVFPITTHYLHPTPEASVWASAGHIPLLIKAFTTTTTSGADDLADATRLEWNRFQEDFKHRVRTSLPEASKEHLTSQKSIADEGHRWFTLAGKLLDAHDKTLTTDRPIPDIPIEPSLGLLRDALDVLETRNWKPFGAASTIESAFKEAPSLFKSQYPQVNDILIKLKTAFSRRGGAFLNSPGASYFFASITYLGQIAERRPEYQEIWRLNTESLLTHIEDEEALPALVKLISSPSAKLLAQEFPALQTELIKRCLICAVGASDSSWDIFDTAITFDIFNEAAALRLVKELGTRIVNSSGQPNSGVIKGLQLIGQKRPRLLSQDEQTHMTLMTSLLSLSEYRDASPELVSLRSLIENPLNSGGSRFIGLLQQNINSVGLNALSVDTLVQQAIQLHSTLDIPGADETEINQIPSLLPDINIWRQELSAVLQETPDLSLSLTSNLGGAYFLADGVATATRDPCRRDRYGCSIPGRMAIYTAKLLASGFRFELLPLSLRNDIVIYLGITAELVTDQITVMSENKIWDSLSSQFSISNAENLVASSRKVITNLTKDAHDWLDGSEASQSGLMPNIIRTLIHETRPLTPTGLYSARVLDELLQSLTENHGFPSSGQEWLTNLDILKPSPSTVLSAIAILTGLGEILSSSRAISNLCNRLVSDIAGAKVQQEKTLLILVLLNACMRVYDIGELPVANNRLVFAVKQITSWLETPEELDHCYAAEVCRALQRLLPCVKDVYGSYWERTVGYCVYLWTERTTQLVSYRLPGIHASLRLASTLQSLEDPNDDLVDVLESSTERRSAALIELLKFPRETKSQPLEIIDSILCRQVDQIPMHHVQDLSELYELVASESRAIQTAAFTVLHKALPAAQQQISVDVLLEKQDAKLSDELLSLLLDAPSLDAYPDDYLALFPNSIRSYLLSWRLVFDSFGAASFKVRSDYAENLKAANYVGPLLDFTFDVLGHSAAHPLNLDKASLSAENIREYDMKLADAEVEERNMQWLLVHLFYLVLKYVPGLFKSWYIECRSKQTKIAVEGWMTKYFSPLIISDALDDVITWNLTQEPPADDEKELSVRVSRTAREVVAGYEVDESQASIAIRIPPEFPLEPVIVVGLNRVAVNERKWQSWIMTTQGVITFSGGSIIDGLTTFRRNIAGAMKGQTECAICYSIISSDKKMPDKRCQTCKNSFHRTCLYKWFQSSSQNTCPLCRNPIDYLGADTRSRRNL